MLTIDASVVTLFVLLVLFYPLFVMLDKKKSVKYQTAKPVDMVFLYWSLHDHTQLILMWMQ